MNAIDLLDRSKVNLCGLIAKLYSRSSDFNDFTVTGVDDAIWQESRIIMKRIAKEEKYTLPGFISECRTLDEAINCISAEMEMHDNEFTLKNYVNTTLNLYMDYLEEQQIDVKIIRVECETPEHLTYAHILEDINKIEKRFNEEDYSGSITSARSLVEGVCNEIVYNLTGKDLEDKLDLPKLFTLVRKHLNLNTDNPKLEQPLKQVISGLINIVNGLAEIRNENGDVHHRRYEVNKHHALVVINSAKTVATFLFNTYEYQLDKGTLVKA